MTIVIPNASEIDLLKFMLGGATPGNQILGLFVNNVTPDDSYVLANLTEMSTLGYSSKSLSVGSWTYVAGTSGNPGVATYATQTWTFTAGTLVNVYGYFIKDTTTGRLLWVEAFASAKPVQNTGDQIIVVPKMQLSHS